MSHQSVCKFKSIQLVAGRLSTGSESYNNELCEELSLLGAWVIAREIMCQYPHLLSPSGVKFVLLTHKGPPCFVKSILCLCKLRREGNQWDSESSFPTGDKVKKLNQFTKL